MPFSRYSQTPVFNFGSQYGTAQAVNLLRSSIAAGALKTKPFILQGSERLDTIAGQLLGDARYWWVLAATSDIGWGMQVPPGTMLNVPDIKDVIRLLG
jgi:hypothetical protein